MPRRGKVKPRKVSPDPIYKNRVVTKLINRAMYEGKKSVVQKQVYRAFEIIKEKLMEYLEGIEDIDYKIQIIEMLEELHYIEDAYNIANNILMSLPPESSRIEFIREIVKRLHVKPIG